MTKHKEKEEDIIEQKDIEKEIEEELTEIEKPGIVERVKNFVRKVKK